MSFTQEETKKLEGQVLQFFQEWSFFENSLSMLLYEILQTPHPILASCVYFTPTSFDARTKIIDTCIKQLMNERKKSLSKFNEPWELINKKISKLRLKRNIIAHGAITPIHILDKEHVLITSPILDFTSFRKAFIKEKLPGLTSLDMKNTLSNLNILIESVGIVRAVLVSDRADDGTLQEIYRELKGCLQRIGSHQ